MKRLAEIKTSIQQKYASPDEESQDDPEDSESNLEAGLANFSKFRSSSKSAKASIKQTGPNKPAERTSKQSFESVKHSKFSSKDVLPLEKYCKGQPFMGIDSQKLTGLDNIEADIDGNNNGSGNCNNKREDNEDNTDKSGNGGGNESFNGSGISKNENEDEKEEEEEEDKERDSSSDSSSNKSKDRNEHKKTDAMKKKAIKTSNWNQN